MRPLSEQQLRLLASPAGYAARGRVRVLGPGGTWYDLTNLIGRDVLEGVDVDEGLDNPAAQATVRVVRELEGLSLAPLMTSSRANNLGGSYSPLLDPGRLFRVEVALTPRGVEPGASDWLPLFLGRIDDVDAGPELVSFTGRDLVGVFQDVWLEAEAVYGSDAGVPLETVCNAILAAAHLSEFSLYTPEASAQALGKFKQEVSPVYDALSRLAAGRGWEVRQKLRSDTGDWGMWLWGPDRTATAPAWTYTANDYEYLSQLAVSLADVRTAVEVVYSDEEDLDATGQPKRKTVRRESATALGRYGWLAADGTRLHRFMRVTEGAASNLRTAAEAGRLADSALADLSTGDVGAQVEVPLHPGLELADLVRLSGNGVNFSGDQVLAVRQVTHSLASTGCRTRLSLLGKPALGASVWLSTEARPGIAPAAPFTGPAAPSGLTATNSVSGAVLLFTAPTVNDGGAEPDEYELHVGTTTGFTIDTSPSSTTLKAVSSSTRFDVTGLAAGLTYYARIVSRDRKGNRGPASAEVTLAPRYVSPGDVNQQVTWAAMPLNADLEAHTDTSRPPDAWTVGSGTWGADAAAETAVVFSGSRSVKLFGGGTTFIQSQRFSVRPGDRLIPSAVVLIPAPENTSHTAALWVFWYDAAGAFVSNVQVAQTYSAGTDVWQTLGLKARPTAVPLSARYASLVVSKSSTGSYSVFVDSTRVALLPDTFVYRYPTTLNGWTSAGGGRAQPRYRMNPLGEIRLGGAITGGPLLAVAFNLDDGDRPGFTADYTCAGNGGPATVRIEAATGAVIPLTGTAPISLDGITFLAEPAGTI